MLSNNFYNQAVKRAMRRVCKCHGMSGSCATQTCWLQLENFAIIGNALKKEYRRASRLRDTDALEAASNSVVQLPQEDGEENSIPNVDARRLVYLDPSPNFCLANKTAGECCSTFLTPSPEAGCQSAQSLLVIYECSK